RSPACTSSTDAISSRIRNPPNCCQPERRGQPHGLSKTHAKRGGRTPPRPPPPTRREEMDFQKLTLKSQEAVAGAQELARRGGNPEVYPEHLLLALLDQELPKTVLERAGESPAALRASAEERLAAKPRIAGAAQQPGVSAAFAKVLDKAFDEARGMDDEFVSVEHLLLALDVIDRKALLEALQAIRGSARRTSQDPEGTYQALEEFGRDLTELAEQGKLDPVIGRDEEIRRVI